MENKWLLYIKENPFANILDVLAVVEKIASTKLFNDFVENIAIMHEYSKFDAALVLYNNNSGVTLEKHVEAIEIIIKPKPWNYFNEVVRITANKKTKSTIKIDHEHPDCKAMNSSQFLNNKHLTFKAFRLSGPIHQDFVLGLLMDKNIRTFKYLDVLHLFLHLVEYMPFIFKGPTQYETSSVFVFDRESGDGKRLYFHEFSAVLSPTGGEIKKIEYIMEPKSFFYSSTSNWSTVFKEGDIFIV